MEPRAPTTDPEGPGGMIVMVRPDPAEAARALALDLHAELILGGSAALRLLHRLDEQTPRCHPSLDASMRPIDATLDDLTSAMRRAEAVRDATRSRVALRLASTLNTRIAIHPDTIRRAALELVSIQHALADESAAAKRRSRLRRGAVIASAAALGLLAAAAVSGALGNGWGVIVSGSAAAITVTVALITLLAARTGRSSSDVVDLHGAHCAAERRWTQVAPAGTPPEAVEQVIHRYEPQHRVVAALLGEHPAVRAAERAAVARRMAWVGAWREALGDDAPLASGPQAHRLQADVLRHGDAEVVLTDPPFTGGILVVASPYDDLNDADALRLHRQLLHPPGGRRVIVVLPLDPEAPSGARLPGSGWVPADPAGIS